MKFYQMLKEEKYMTNGYQIQIISITAILMNPSIEL